VSNGSPVLIITVNFRHAECTLQFLASASRLEGFDGCHFAIIDNNSGDDSPERIKRAIAGFNNVELASSPSNRGYFGAAKWALDAYQAQRGAPDWIVVCNNDIVFDDPQFLNRLLAHDPQTVGVLAPSILSRLTGFDSNPMIPSKPGRARRWRYRFLLSNYYVAWLVQWLAPVVRKGRNHLRTSKSTRSREPAKIYAPHGSFLIFSRKFFDAGGFLDDGCFLYGEEITVAETCCRLGLPILHDPELKVSHEDSQTLGRVLTRSSYKLQKAGLRYALGKYLESSRGL
jgi:GT2 family glycosyltransferase